MTGAPNTRGQKYWVRIVQWAPETLVSEEIADIFGNYNIDVNELGHQLLMYGLSPGWHQAITWTTEDLLLIDHQEQISMTLKFQWKYQHFYWRKSIEKCCMQNGDHFILASMCYLI